MGKETSGGYNDIFRRPKGREFITKIHLPPFAAFAMFIFASMQPGMLTWALISNTMINKYMFITKNL